MGAIRREVISQIAISKSIWGNLKRLADASVEGNREQDVGVGIPFEEPRHAETGASCAGAGRSAAEVWGAAVLAGKGDVRVHGGEGKGCAKDK